MDANPIHGFYRRLTQPRPNRGATIAADLNGGFGAESSEIGAAPTASTGLRELIRAALGAARPVSARRIFGFTRRRIMASFQTMSIITAILDPQSDGTLHLPLPAELSGGRVKVTATLAAADETGDPSRATAEMVRQRMEALGRLRALNPFRDLADPVAWQREIRQDRPLPGRA